MTGEEKETLINQVFAIIKQQKGSDTYPYYSHFVNECNGYGLSEEDFNKVILKSAFELFDGETDEDPESRIPNPNRYVDLFGERCYNTWQLARVLFNHPHKSEEYLEDASLIKHDIAYLSNSDKALEFSRVYKSESNSYRRYLRIVYKLHNKLPYRIGSDNSGSLIELLKKGFQNYNFYGQLVNEFINGRLQIWLQETDPVNAAKLNDGFSYEDFLRFIYKVDNTYPFYINEQLFLTPADLVNKAQKEMSFWDPLYWHIHNGQIPLWFDSIGKAEWNQRYQTEIEIITKSVFHNEQEKKLAAVQTLMRIIDSSIEPPKVGLNIESLSFLTIEADKMQHQSVTLKLKNKGFVKWIIPKYLAIQGLSISPTEAVFHDLSGNTEREIKLSIDPSKLIRNKTYSRSLLFHSIYETVEIPIEFKVVFPARAFINETIKYATILAAFFALIRYFLALEYPMWLREQFNFYLDWESAFSYPGNFSIFGWLFFFLTTSLLIGFYYLFKRYVKYGQR